MSYVYYLRLLVSIVYCGDNVVYKTCIIEIVVTLGKRNTQCIERKYSKVTLN
jgi:hypothetical protein